MCLSSGRWWLVRSRSLRCGRSLRPLWTSRGPRRIQSTPYWSRGVGRGAFSTSWRMFWIHRCCGSSTVSIRIALCLALRVGVLRQGGNYRDTLQTQVLESAGDRVKKVEFGAELSEGDLKLFQDEQVGQLMLESTKPSRQFDIQGDGFKK
uniref:Uncharacterized protein n=1 Tax=Hucho hucho TaxID=62062 RepID=A0A4W5NUZ7_9TELE